MGWVSYLIDASRLVDAWSYAQEHPGMVLAVGAMVFFLLRGNLRATLILAFGVTLCWANYYIIAQQIIFAVPLVYAVGFAAVSTITLLLLVYQFIQTA